MKMAATQISSHTAARGPRDKGDIKMAATQTSSHTAAREPRDIKDFDPPPPPVLLATPAPTPHDDNKGEISSANIKIVILDIDNR